MGEGCFQVPLSNFVPALSAGMDKLNSYYQQSAESDAHIMAMGDTLFCAHKFDVH